MASSATPPPGSPDPAGQDGRALNRPAPTVENQDAAEEEDTELAPDAMRDPMVAQLIHRRILIDTPRFTLETGGKMQVQYCDSDSADPETEDELLLW